MTLVQLRRANPLFPLRPFLAHLVDALEDGDGTVRECARQSVVEIFTASGVTDAARTDLKKEMTKKGVRKTIVDSVLAKLLGGEGRHTPSGDSVDGKEEPAASSGMPPRKPSAPNIPTVGRSMSQGAAELDRPASRAGEAIAGEQDATPVYVRSEIVILYELRLFCRLLPLATSNMSSQACYPHLRYFNDYSAPPSSPVIN